MRSAAGRVRIPAVATLALALVLSVCLLPLLAAQASPGARGLIWEVTREGRTNWLVGSLHVLTPDHYPLPAAMEEAFAKAATLVEEVETADAGGPQMLVTLMTRGLFTDGRTLDQQVPPDLWAQVADRASRTGLGVEMIRPMRPWLAALTLVSLELQRAGFDPEHGIDRYFRRRAAETGKAFIALETAEAQINYLASFPAPVQEELLRSSLEDADRQIQEVEALVEAWRAGEAAALEHLLLDTFRDSPEVYATLIVERNRRWMPAVEACLARGDCFIVVGAGHTVGEDGLVEMLRGRGYEVRQR
jgi:uncharacterized protein